MEFPEGFFRICKILEFLDGHHFIYDVLFAISSAKKRASRLSSGRTVSFFIRRRVSGVAIKKNTPVLKENLTSPEQKSLQDIAQVFGIKVFVKNKNNGALLAIGQV